MHYRAGEELHQRVYDTVKSVRPTARVGRHLDHSQVSWDMFYRAAMPYSRMTPCSDFLKLSTYHDILGPRLAGRVAGYRQHLLRELSPEQALAFFYAIAGHDPKTEPGWDALAETGLSQEYVHREVLRAVAGVAGKSQFTPASRSTSPRLRLGQRGLAQRSRDRLSRPRRAFDAGAAGIVICREYEEMREPSLRAMAGPWRDFKL